MTAVAGVALPFVLAALIILRQNIIVLLGVATFAAYYFWGGGEVMNVVYDMWDASNREVLLSVPLYILAGAIMSQGSIAERLINLMKALMRPIPGGLALASLLACGIFAAISGSSIVTLLAVGSIMYPALLKAGYDRKFAIGMLCAGGTLGIIIPPSIPLILYGIMTQASIADLFIAGIGPGLMLLGAFMLYSLIVNWHRDRGGMWSPREIVQAAKDSIWALMTPFVILGGIYSGYFTPTESAAVAVLTAILVETLAHRHGFVHLMRGNMAGLGQTWRDMGNLVWRVVGETSTMMGGLFPVLALALSLNVFMTYEQVPNQLVEWLTGFIDSKVMFLILVNLFLLVVGCFLDAGSAILILSPLLPPMAQTYGIDLIHFGIIMNVNLEIGYLTPPMGINLIVAMGAFKEEFLTIVRGVLPFIGIMVVCLWIIAMFPQISLFMID
ncbi:MAG: TRAP transporter large permease [Rhodospirillaceae bacterium]|nr:TRAP transporter large permease [Rhodospirillaceae bacterium]